MEDIKVVIDCGGADNTKEIIIGAINTLNEVDGVDLILVGNGEEIEKETSLFSFDKSRLEIVNSSSIIENVENPVVAIRQKNDASIVKAYQILKEREGVIALISAGSTGALLVGSMLCLGKEYLLDMPYLASLLPTDNGKYVCLADCGANIDCTPNQLLSFAKYSAKYMQSYFGIENPKVALLSVGTEETKGNAVTKEAFKLLKESPLNFIGNIEGKSVLLGEADVVVCDGFSGNILLKNIEGTAKSIIGRLNAIIKKNASENDDLSLVKKSFKELMQKIDFNTQGGAVVLGVKKIIIKAHGSANRETVLNTVKQAKKVYQGGFYKYFN